MPKVARWFIKAGIIYFITGVLLSFLAEIPALNAGAMLLPVYFHMLVTGWITQVIMGVSLWMFPRKHRDKKKRESVLSWMAFWLLNSGLVLRFISEPFLPVIQNSTIISVLVVISSILQISAIAAYVAEIWPRLQSRKKRKRSQS